MLYNVEKSEEKVKSLLKVLGLDKFQSEIKEGKVSLQFPVMIPQQIQQEINKKLYMKPVPKLCFVIDKVEEKAQQIEKLLGKMKKRELDPVRGRFSLKTVRVSKRNSASNGVEKWRK